MNRSPRQGVSTCIVRSAGLYAPGGLVGPRLT